MSVLTGYALRIYNRAVSSAIMDKSGRVISGRKISRVRRTRSIFRPEITSIIVNTSNDSAIHGHVAIALQQTGTLKM